MRIDVAAALLRRCRSPDALPQGRQIHAAIASAGLDRNTFIANLLIQMYSACGSHCDAQDVFHAGNAGRNVYSWTIALQAFVQAGELVQARELFWRMPCTAIFAWNSIIAGFSRLGGLDDARKLFDSMPEKDLVSWNTMIATNAQRGHSSQALVFFQAMDLEGIEPDSISYVSALNAVAGIEDLDAGIAREISGEVLRFGIETEVTVGTALIVLFGRTGEMDCCEISFDRILSRNHVSWNALLLAFAQNGHLFSTRFIFYHMPYVDIVSCTTMINANTQSGLVYESKDLFDRMPQKDLALWNSLLSAFAVNGYHVEALHCFKLFPVHDLFSKTSLVIVYGATADLSSMLNLFHKTTHRDVTLCNALITALAQNGHLALALNFFEAIDCPKNRVTYLIAIDACGGLGDPSRCEAIFQRTQSIRSLRRDAGISSALIRMFGRAGDLPQAEAIATRNISRRELWNTMLSTYSHIGRLDEAMLLFNRMPRRDLSSWIVIVKSHTHHGLLDRALVLLEISPEIALSSCNALILAYLHHGRLTSARKLFDSMPHRDAASWSSIISAYTHLGYPQEALSLFRRLDAAHDRPAFLAALDACSALSSAPHCREIHAAATATGWISDLAVATALVAAYGKSRALDEARAVFDRVHHPSIVSWNTLLRCYIQNGDLSTAKSLIEGAVPGPEVVSFNTLAAGYIQHGMIDEAVDILSRKMPCWDCFSINTMMLAHAQAGDLDQAREMFEKVTETTSSGTVPWNTMVCLLVQGGECDAAARTFSRMDLEGVSADRVSFVAVLDALGKLTDIRNGRVVHGEIQSSKFRCDAVIGNALVSFYGRCGELAEARVLFESTSKHDEVCWNGIVSVFANNGKVDSAVELVWRMCSEGVLPDGVTFVSVLAVCSHGGWLELARGWFQALVIDFGIDPSVEHFMCVVDLLCRLGRLDDAYGFVEGLPVEPGSVAYMTILGACRMHGDVRVGSLVALTALAGAEAPAYVLVSQISGES